ncbi:MAG: hypothetical protein OEX14_09925 [Paracoccaceae bacterium]|nr:hypothetical protein [Paracoccaceae bacterium]
MFDLFTKPITDALDVAGDSVDWFFGDGEGPSREKVASLISAGLTVAAIAHGFGVAEDVIERLLPDGG